MYPVTELYKNKILENTRTFKTIVEIQHSTGVLFLYDKDLVSGVLEYTESSQSGDEFTIGSTVASDISLTLFNRPEYANINFMGATIIVTTGLEVVPGMGLTYEQLKEYTYDELRQFTYQDISGVYEYVPLGRFNIDDVNKQRNTIGIKAVDNMIEFDKPYSLSNLSYPATLYQIYVDACNVCDVNVGTTTFPNMNHTVQEKPTDDLTFRDIIGYVGELSGTFAKVNRGGALELKWYTNSGLSLGPSNRFNFKPSDHTVQIKGIRFETTDTIYLAGTDDYAIDLSGNPLLQSDYGTVVSNIFDAVKGIVYTPYESSWKGDPAVQAGELITHTDRDGKIYNTLITSSTYKYRGAGTMSARGLPEISKGFKGSTNKRIANIVRKEIGPIGNKLTTLEQAQLNATELIANMLGGYAIVEEDSIYIADNENLSLAQKVWKWGIGGFGYSENGVNGPYTTAITADGSIVAMNIAANIITASMVQTGILQSTDGSTWINLDDGTFNFKNMLKYMNNKLSLSSTFGNGLMEIDDTKGFVAYKDGTKQEFTQLYPGGLYRVKNVGGTEQKSEYHYLSVTGTGEILGNPEVEPPIPHTPAVIQLPDDFRGKNFTVQVSLREIGFFYDDDVVSGTFLDVVNVDYENARFTVDGYIRRTVIVNSSGGGVGFWTYNAGLKFNYIAIV